MVKKIKKEIKISWTFNSVLSDKLMILWGYILSGKKKSSSVNIRNKDLL